MHISSVIKISFCRISFSGHQNKFCSCSDISWHRLNLNQSKTNCPKNLNSDGLIVREMGPWPECIFRSLLQFLVTFMNMLLGTIVFFLLFFLWKYIYFECLNQGNGYNIAEDIYHMADKYHHMKPLPYMVIHSNSAIYFHQTLLLSYPHREYILFLS